MISATSKTLDAPVAVPAVDATLQSARVQTLRGAACMLLVAYHVVGNDSLMGLRVQDSSAWRSFAELLIHLRMPLFTFLSGFVYAYRPIRPGKEALFARKKFMRLFVPLVAVSTVYFLLQQVAPDVNWRRPWSQMWQIYFMPYAHFWFLQAIILIFAAVGVLDRFGAMRRLSGYLVVFAIVLALHFYVAIHPSVFSSNQALYLFPFFLAGLGANRFAPAFHWPTVRYLCLIVFAVTMTLHVLAVYHVYGEVAERRTYFATALSLAGLLTMLYWTPPSRALTWIGSFSFTIYLYHVFFTGGMRAALHAFGVPELPLNFVAGCIAGLAGPIVVELVLRRSAILRRVFLGQS
jgi:fucose 4-O-acetylase-like acetyltransferase